jgi:hypothetical protein
MDDQLLELRGRHRLIESLLGADLEVAFPARDHGIDLIGYSDVDLKLGRFVAKPIQMKAASEASFSIDQKYSKFPDLLIAYVWNVSQPANTQIFLLRQDEAIRIATEMGYTGSASWTGKGAYVVTRPGQKLIEKLRPYLVSREKWRDMIRGKTGDSTL